MEDKLNELYWSYEGDGDFESGARNGVAEAVRIFGLSGTILSLQYKEK